MARFIILLATLLAAPHAEAACFGLGGEVTDTFLRAVVYADAPEPHALVACALPGEAGVSGVTIAISAQPPVALAAVPTVWEQLWAETDPRAVHRPPPSVGSPAADGPPPVLSRLGRSGEWASDQSTVLVEPDATFDLPLGTEALIHISGTPGEPSGLTWYGPVRVPLTLDEDGSTLPLAIGADHPGTIELMVVGQGGQQGLRGTVPLTALDLWTLEEEEAERSGTTLLVPDLRVSFMRERRDGFHGLYATRREEHRVAGQPNALLHYMGPARPGAEWPVVNLTRPQFLFRVELVGPWSGVPVGPLGAAWYRAAWVSIDADEDAVQPDQVSLDDDSILFGMGAEAPQELSPGMILLALENRASVLTSCARGEAGSFRGEVAIVVEPGGHTLAAFAAFGRPRVETCLVETLRDRVRFPTATGAPILVRFPLEMVGYTD